MSKTSVARFLPLAALILAYGSAVGAQVATGTPPFGSFGGGPDVINLGNLNAHLSIPIVNKAGRGMPFLYNLGYDSSIWYPVTSSGMTTWQPLPDWGWTAQTAPTTGYIVYSWVNEGFCTDRGARWFLLSNWIYYDPVGVPHPFPGSVQASAGPCNTSMTSTTTDGSGYTLTVTNTEYSKTYQLTSRAGKGIISPVSVVALENFYNAGTGGSLTDRNGNQISVNGSGVFTDTLGQTALTISQNTPGPTSPTTYTYTAPSGANASYTTNYTSYTVATNFGVSGIVEYGATAVSLVSSIVLPDATQYTFTYEATPSTPSSGACTPKAGTYAANCVTGRLATMTLPTGGTISYAYTGGNNGILSDGSAAGLTRTVNPGGEWQYTRSGSGTAWTTTISDPSTPSNQTVINFQSVTPAAGTPSSFYETERQVYQGPDSGTPLKTIYTCYNGTASPCNSTAISQPIAQRTVVVQWPGTGGLESKTNTNYNTNGLVTERDEYAYGPGTSGSLVRKTLTSYASLGNGIVSMPAVITVEDGSSNIKAQTTYCYDEGTPSGTTTCAATGPPTATSGTPQHVAVTGSRGNVTTIASLVQGSTTLGKKFTYFDTGTVQTFTDLNGAVTTDAYGTSSCGNSFVTSVTEPLSLSRSIAWNCTGGVETSVTDENGQLTSVTYNDADFWRPNAMTDQESNVTNLTYTEQTSVEASLNFGTSTSDVLENLDGFGRTHVSQLREAPGSSTFDSVETDYDSVGRPTRTTLPYTGTADQTSSSAPGTTTTYDALSRKSLVTDSGGRTVTFAYSQNDTYRTVSPAPTGENTKRKQFEYDALGRLTSVCEVTSATGSGTCAQTSTATGYWTTYSYDVLNHLIGVTQNAQSTGSKQTRTYAYDDLGRMTSETNPESGTTTYTYDTDTTCGTSKGDLVKKIDAVGNTTCYAYDALHRPTSVTVPTGTYAASTPAKHFVYDAATVNSVVMSNVKARLAEAYTCTGSCTSKITDLGFSYTVRGEPSDIYESTPHSGGYFHTSATYWANGALDALTAKYGSAAITGLPNFTYAPDGEGRISTVSASAGQNPVTATAYSVASLPTQVTFGSSDTDSFSYDPNSNRMTKYTFKVNGQSLIGTLTWNSIGTLETLAITDPFYGSGNQTCNYTHDDISRIASANCGSPWSQTFSYDAFSNISKSGTVSFQPTYSYLTNRMTQVGSSTPTYDANGNATNDTLHTYAWDAAGRPVTTDTVGLTYDALGRMVEQNKSGAYSQIVYTPVGTKFAIMNGSTLTKAFVPLTGGSQAVYNSSGLAYYRHSDWVGSSRFASTPARAMYYDGAYAPFGEAYAQTGTADLSFTGMNQDTVANLYDFPAREYNNIHGRWPSPDPAGMMSAHIKDPQTWNRYAYVRNSPLNSVDPLGMDCSNPGDFDGGDGNGCDPSAGPEGPGDGGGDPPDPCASDPSSCVPPGGGDCGIACPTDPNAPPPGQPNGPDTGCQPGDFSCDPFSNSSPCANPYSGTCNSPLGATADGGLLDPCVYTNDDGTSNVDRNSSPDECSRTQGHWVPDGWNYGVDSNGNVTLYPPPPQSLAQSACSAISWGSKFSGFAALGASSLYWSGGTTLTLGLGAPVATSTSTLAAPGFAVVGGGLLVAGLACNVFVR